MLENYTLNGTPKILVKSQMRQLIGMLNVYTLCINAKIHIFC